MILELKDLEEDENLREWGYGCDWSLGTRMSGGVGGSWSWAWGPDGGRVFSDGSLSWLMECLWLCTRYVITGNGAREGHDENEKS